MYPTPYVASLRMYEPIESFPLIDKQKWIHFSKTPSSTGLEQKQALIRLIKSEPPHTNSDGAYFLEHKGENYVAPWSTTFRCWRALEDFKYTLPHSVREYFFSKHLEQLIKVSIIDTQDAIPYILTSTWSIPPRWFALFRPEERLRGENQYGPYTILRTAVHNAINRAKFTHQAVVGAFGKGPVEREIVDLIYWLEIFDNLSIVELDYGGLASYLNDSLIMSGEPGISADSSIEDVNTSIAGLASGDSLLAGKGYERLVSRWRRVASLESST